MHFGFTEGERGTRVVALQSPLSPDCATDEEVDAVIDELQADLDRLRDVMKQKLKERPTQSLFGKFHS